MDESLKLIRYANGVLEAARAVAKLDPSLETSAGSRFCPYCGGRWSAQRHRVNHRADCAWDLLRRAVRRSA